ncbi:MAG: hypothetical protein AB7E21_03235 [Pseudodonghicola sp.]
MKPWFSDGSHFAYRIAMIPARWTRWVFPTVLLFVGCALDAAFGLQWLARVGGLLVAYSLFVLWVQLRLASDREGIEEARDWMLRSGVKPTGAFEHFEKTGTLAGYERELSEGYAQFSKTAHGSEEWKLKGYQSNIYYMNEMSERLPRQRSLEASLITIQLAWAGVGTVIWTFGDWIANAFFHCAGAISC